MPRPRRIALHFPAIFLLAMSLMLAAGCDREPRVDGASPEALEASIVEISARMSEEDASRFHDAIEILMMHEINQAAQAFPDAEAQQQHDRIDRRFRERVDGQTASQIVQQVIDLAEDQGARSTDPND